QAALGGEAAGWQRLDARDVLVVQPGEMGVAVDWEASRERFADWRSRQRPAKVVVTGFVARERDGRCTTLGRNGSDYSAAIFANLFDASELLIWTDVDGVLSADPRLVPDAMVLPTMSYAEACELAYFGAKVLHPQTMAPVQSRSIPLCIRNTLNPAARGTWILAENPEGDAALSPVKGLTIVRDMAVLELVGNGMVGVPGAAERLFAALHRAGVSVVMISQGSSEHSICCVVRAGQAERARAAVEAAFADSIASNGTQGVNLTSDIAILAAVGDGMVGIPGVAARLFAALAQAQVNIRAIAQGSSERNISVAIADADATRGLRAAHSAFWLSPQTVSIGLIGPGQVGRALLSQLAAVLPKLRANSQIDLRLRGVANSGYMALDHFAIHPDEAVERPVEMSTPAFGAGAFAAHVRRGGLPRQPPRRAPAARADRGLQRQRGGGAPLSRMAGLGHPRGHPEQARRQRRLAALCRHRRGSAQRRALHVRGHGGRRPAGDQYAAQPARHRRRDRGHRRHALGHAGVAVQQLRRQPPVLGAGAPGARDGLYRTRSARRPVGPGRGPQAGDPGTRSRARTVAGRRGRGKPGARAPAGRAARRVPRPARGAGRADAGAAGGGAGRRTVAAAHRPPVPGQRRARWGDGAAGRTRLLPHPPDRQPGAVHHRALCEQPAGRAGPGRRAAGDRGRRVRRHPGDRAFAQQRDRRAGMNRSATAFAPASVGNIGVGFDLLGHAIDGPRDL